MAETSSIADRKPEAPGWWTSGRIAWSVGAAAFLAVFLTLGDPGITIDEPLDVRPGRTYLATLRARGFRFFERETVAAVFRDNAEHPPLGRWLLGIASTLGEPFEVLLRGGRDPIGLYIVSGRVAPALCFGAMVGLISAAAGRRYGRAAGFVAGASLFLMPRAFAHAHLGALDTFIAFFWALALLSAVKATEGRRPLVGMGFAGLAWGLALLTKIHAWFLPPIVLAWALSRLNPGRAVAACSIWTVVGLSTFFAGWPWLWYAPVERLGAYLGTGVERVSIRVLYFGQVYADRDVPWHYPWFYFAATVPVGLLGLGVWGIIRRGHSQSAAHATEPLSPEERGAKPGESNSGRSDRFDPFALLLAGSIGTFLGVFSTRIPVYDGERLFLVVFPLFAILVGRGFGSLWVRAGRKGRVALVALIVGQGYGVMMLHPFGLSYYNLLVGGLPGAERLGLELTYWGDAVDAPLLDELASRSREGDTVALAPTLAPGQGTVATTRRLLAEKIVIADEDQAVKADWLVISRRTAYWPAEVRERLARDPLVATRTRQGVWLSALLGRRKSGFP